jgi:hypothetical protein
MSAAPRLRRQQRPPALRAELMLAARAGAAAERRQLASVASARLLRGLRMPECSNAPQPSQHPASSPRVARYRPAAPLTTRAVGAFAFLQACSARDVREGFPLRVRAQKIAMEQKARRPWSSL